LFQINSCEKFKLKHLIKIMKKIIQVFFTISFCLLATFAVNMPQALASPIDNILNKKLENYPSVSCDASVLQRYKAANVKVTCVSGQIQSLDYLTVGTLTTNNLNPVTGSFSSLTKTTGQNPTLGEANSFFNKLSPGDFPFSSSDKNQQIGNVPLVKNLASGLGISGSTTLGEALKNSAFANASLSIPDDSKTSLRDAIPGGGLEKMNISSIKDASSITMRDMQAFGTGKLSLKDLGAKLQPGFGTSKFDVALGTPRSGSTENNILANVVTGGSNGAAQSVNCSGKSCPHVEGNGGKRFMESSFQVPDGFGSLCKGIDCKGPSGTNALGINPQLSLNSIGQKKDTANLAVSFRFCITIPDWSCSPAFMPTPSGIPIGQIKRGDGIPYLATVATTAAANNRGGDSTGGSSVPYTNGGIATNLPVPSSRNRTGNGNAIQIRVKENGGYAEMGVERVACKRDGGNGYCLKIKDLAKLKKFLDNMGIELAYDFKEGDLMKELSNNYVLKDSEKFTKYLAANNLIDPNTGAVSGVNLKGVTCKAGTSCDNRDTNIASGPSSAGGYWMHPMRGGGNSRQLIPNGYFGAPRSGHVHAGIDVQSSANTLTFTSKSTGAGIYAANNGTVTKASFPSPSISSRINISHGNGIQTSYVHATDFTVQGGQISKGAMIAKEGAMGVHTGAHLHFEVYINGEPVNPLRYSWTPSIGGQQGQSLTFLPDQETEESSNVEVSWGLGFFNISKVLNIGGAS
jgi:murein DD-endopeptidase MepM/ murein hydrolase activator NlpD